jgi:NADH-quinone oxidoreductase subunit N
MASWTMWLPAAVAALGAVVSLGCDAFGARRAAIASAIAAAVAAVVVCLLVQPVPLLDGDVMRIAGERGPMGAAISLLVALALFGGWRSMTTAPHGGQTAALGALSLSASLVVVAAQDLLALVIGLEAMALAAYALVALGGSDRSREAAMKYFIQGAAATGLLILSIGILLISGGASGFAGLWDIGAASAPTPAMLLAWALLLCVFAFKAAAFPFHSWAPDAYQTADPPVAALLASAPKVAVVVAAAYLFVPVASGEMAGVSPLPAGVFAVLAVGSIVFGNLVALRQTSLARMLAYSGIAQVGYALVGFATGSGASVSLFMVVYGLAAAGAFLAVQAIAEGDPGWDGAIGGLAGLSRRMPVVAASLVVLMMSLTGMPLFAGFVGKLAVFGTAIGTWTWLAVLGMLGSVVSFGYYGSVLRAAYLLEPKEAAPAGSPPWGPAALAVAIAAALVVALGIGALLTSGAWLGLVLRG